VELTPDSISNPQLPRAKVGGYSVEATDELLKKISWEWIRLQSDRKKLTERTAELERQLADINQKLEELRGESVIKTQPEPRTAAALAAAYRAADAIRDEARSDSEKLLKKARSHAVDLDKELERARAANAERIRDLERTQKEAREKLSAFLVEMLDAVGSPDVGRTATATTRRTPRPVEAAPPAPAEPPAESVVHELRPSAPPPAEAAEQ
jgi:cell division septum initiation protein DivIVA